jgi:hypothetical protein
MRLLMGKRRKRRKARLLPRLLPEKKRTLECRRPLDLAEPERHVEANDANDSERGGDQALESTTMRLDASWLPE